MRKILRFTLMAAMALISASSMAQTTVTFDAKTDKGKYDQAPTSGEQYDTLSKEGVVVVCNKGAFATGKQYRFGKGGFAQISSTAGNITKVVFTCTVNGTAKWGPGNFTDATAGTYTYQEDGNEGTWEGNDASFQLTASGSQVRATKIEVTIGGTVTPSLAAPTISGETPFAETTTVTIAAEDGATVYYTTNGQDPDDREGTQYTAPFTLSETATVKAIAYKGDLQSTVATKEFKKQANVKTTGNGTVENPYTAADAVAMYDANALPADTAFYTGVITSVKEVSTQFGNATYAIAAAAGAQDSLEVFRGYYLENKKFTAEDQIKVGDKVVVKGKLIDYKGTLELGQRNYIYSLNGKTTAGDEPVEPKDTASYTVDQALSVLVSDAETTDVVYITGKISQIDEVSAQYGNATYYISDDGTTANQLMVFRGKYLNNEKFTAEDQIKVGDEVKIAGVLKNYKKGDTVTKEVTNSYIVSLNTVPTGISSVVAAPALDANAPVYNLAGQRVNKSYKGVVVQNGRKFILK
ncbi:FN3 associated domain-containing protein [Prevotella lacticifex]|nr:FN3 associated domain-containing protein [Prevotella lacticifex]